MLWWREKGNNANNKPILAGVLVNCFLDFHTVPLVATLIFLYRLVWGSLRILSVWIVRTFVLTRIPLSIGCIPIWPFGKSSSRSRGDRSNYRDRSPPSRSSYDSYDDRRGRGRTPQRGGRHQGASRGRPQSKGRGRETRPKGIQWNLKEKPLY